MRFFPLRPYSERGKKRIGFSFPLITPAKIRIFRLFQFCFFSQKSFILFTKKAVIYSQQRTQGSRPASAIQMPAPSPHGHFTPGGQIKNKIFQTDFIPFFPASHPGPSAPSARSWLNRGKTGRRRQTPPPASARFYHVRRGNKAHFMLSHSSATP